VRWYETQDAKLVIEDLDQDALLLLWIAKKFKLDLRILLFLYNEYGKNIWFFFHMMAGLTVKFPALERLLKMVKDVQKVISGGTVDSAVGKFAKQLLSRQKVELDLRDRTWFKLGVLGLYEEEEVLDDREDFVKEVKRETD
jgi:hypothetical protein